MSGPISNNINWIKVNLQVQAKMHFCLLFICYSVVIWMNFYNKAHTSGNFNTVKINMIVEQNVILRPWKQLFCKIWKLLIKWELSKKYETWRTNQNFGVNLLPIHRSMKELFDWPEYNPREPLGTINFYVMFSPFLFQFFDIVRV